MSQETAALVRQEVAFEGYFKVVRYFFRHTLHKGGMSGIISREVFERGQAGAALLYDPQRDEVVLIRQFRPGAYAAGMEPWLWEIIAGILEANETPEQLIVREAREEANIAIADPITIGRYLVSPGGTSETCAIFCARTDAAQAAGVHGLASENEDIAVHALPFAQILAMLEQGQFQNAKTIIGLQWLVLHRERLRKKWG